MLTSRKLRMSALMLKLRQEAKFKRKRSSQLSQTTSTVKSLAASNNYVEMTKLFSPTKQSTPCKTTRQKANPLMAIP